MNTKPIIITGPTASGKSDFAHSLARKINGAVIDCDSVQIYRGIENISASPFAGKTGDFSEIDGVPYKLFSILSLDEHISVSDYLKMAKDALNEVVALGKIPIFVGGTGYYINVLLNGISSIPNVSDENRTRAREMVKNDLEQAKQILSNDFDKSDPQRMARALEVFFETGIHLSKWQKQPRVGALIPDAFKILILPPREILIERIAKRIPEMINGGALHECENIIANHQDETRAIGAMQICSMLRGEISKENAIQNWITKTNQYAKRQRTWFKGQYNADFSLLHTPTNQDIDDVIRKITD
nr:tRNA (adenosine(37)-N6)-dimethylallyltransferase MiaA [Candidatus Enterousia merdequi]